MEARRERTYTVNEGAPMAQMTVTLSYRSGWWTAECAAIGVSSRSRDRFKAYTDVENQLLRTDLFRGLPAKALKTNGIPARTPIEQAKPAAANGTARRPGRPRKVLEPAGSTA